MLTYPVQEWQMRRNHNNSFCVRNLFFVNNRESIPNSPKDSIVCKTAFQFTASLARARPWMLLLLEEECGAWRGHGEQRRLRKGKVAAAGSILVFSEQADPTCFLPAIPVLSSHIRHYIPAPVQFLDFHLLLDEHSRKY